MHSNLSRMMDQSQKANPTSKWATVSLCASFSLLFALQTVTPSAASPSLGFSTQTQGVWTGTTTLKVVENSTLTPIPDAVVSMTLGNLGANSTSTVLGKTDAQGSITATQLPSGPKFFTASKSGYVTISVATGDVTALSFFLKVRSSSAQTQTMMTGKTSGWEAATDSSLVYAGLVFRTLSASDLSQFDPNNLVSPIDDTINVMGQHNIPSNIVFPNQNPSYLFFSFNLNKPTYRLPLSQDSSTQLVSLQGKAPVQAVMDAQQAGGMEAYLEVLNQLKVTKIGVSNPINVAGTNSTLDILSGTNLVPSHQVKITPPPFASDVVVAAVTDMQGDRTALVPTDIKMAMKNGETSAKTVKLSAPTKGTLGVSKHIVSFAVDLETVGKSAFLRRTSGILALNAGANFSTSSFLDTPRLTDSAQLPSSFDLEAQPSSIAAYTFSTLDHSQTSDQWIVYVTPEAGHIRFAPVPMAGITQNLEIATLQLEFSSFNGANFDGQSGLQNLSRFSRSIAKVGTARGFPENTLLDRLFGWLPRP